MNEPSNVRRALRLLSLIGINAVPGGEFLFAGWSGSTALAFY